MGRLEGKTALITGGGRGIGKGIARRFAAEGARLALAQRDRISLVATVEEIELAGGHAVALPADVSDPASVSDLVESALDALGRIDILVNNAARAGQYGHFLEVSLEEWHAFIAANLTSVFLVAQAVARHMADTAVQGRIVNLGSVDSFAAEKRAAPYAASKGGVWLLTRAMAVDLAPHGILVNMLAPGPILVERNVRKYASEQVRALFEQAVPLGTHGTVDDIAAAALFLAGDECGFITGSAITIDGGVMAALPF